MTTSMGLSGDLQVLPLLETLNVLSRHKKSGSLTLKTNSSETIIYFLSGSVTAVRTDDESLRIGRFLVDQGFVTDEQIEQALALQSVVPHPDRIGDVLVDVGFVSPEQISSAVSAQLEAALFRVLTHEGGTFQYVEEPVAEGEKFASEIDFEPLLLNATYLADKWLAEQQPADVDTLPEELIDPAILDRLSHAEREAMLEMLEVYAGLHQLAWNAGISASQFKKSVELLLQRAMVRIAVESHEDEQIAGRENARNERLVLTDEFIDPWILDDLPPAAKEILLMLLDGAQSMQTLARRAGRPAEQFRQAVERLLSERLVKVRPLSDDSPDGIRAEDHVVRESFRLAGDFIPADTLSGLSKSERQTLVALLNGASSVREMAQQSGLPTSMFHDGANSLIDRGFLYRDDQAASSP